MFSFFNNLTQTPKGRFALFLGIAAIIIGGVALYVNFDGKYIPNGEVKVGALEIEAVENQDPNLILAYFEPNQGVGNAVGLRYKFRVNQNQNQSPTSKIIFNNLAFYNPDTGRAWYYFLENNIFANWVEYFDNQYTNCQFAPQGQNHPVQAGFWPAISDYWRSGLVGVRQVDENTKNMFPRQNSGIDYMPGVTKIETISQMNMNGKDVSVEILRGDILNVTQSIEGWGYRWVPDPNNPPDPNKPDEPGHYLCESKLPPAEYRTWNMTSIIDGVTYGHQFLIPESHAKYIHQDIKSFFTEFFKTLGLFQTYLWDIKFLRDNSSTWETIRKWRVGTSYGGTDSKTNGFKIATYNNHPVIEVSNDGTDTYYKSGDIFEVNYDTNISGSISASPNPCSIPLGATFCSTTINWTTTGGATNSVVTVTLSPGGSESVFEYSGASGSKVASIAGSPYTYLFKLYQSFNATPLAQVTVTGTASAASGLPDLVVSSLSHSPVSPSVGSAMSFTGIVRNSGAGAAGASQAGLYIDINNDGSLDVNNIPFQPTGSLAANATETKTWSNAWTAVAGTHKYMICADVTAVVTEVAGDVTNCASAVFTVGSGTGGTTATLTVVSPNGGESWQTGETRAIIWNTANINIPSETTVNVNLDLIWPTSSGFASMLFGQLLPNTGQYQWTIPSTIALRNDYKIQARLLHLLPSGSITEIVRDQSDAVFSIGGSGTGGTTATLTVSKIGTGTGLVTGTGIHCGSDCSEVYASGAIVALTATPSTSAVFASWSGGCSGTATTCAVSMNVSKTVTATFNNASGGAPTGSITASPNPCSIPLGATFCSTTINWTTTGGVTNSVVTVTLSPGGSESVFEYSGASGSKVASIAGSPYTYLFKLYQSFNATPLAQVTVTGITSGVTQSSICSTGSIRACIDSISPNPANKGEVITFKGHGETDNPNKTIKRYRWRLDSTYGQSGICQQGEGATCQFNSRSVSLGTHKVYFRVSTDRYFGGWSKWISREFGVR